MSRAPCLREGGPALCLFSSDSEAHALEQLAGHETLRAQAHSLLDRALRAVGARPAAIELWRSCDSCIAARLLIEREGPWCAVDVETTQAVALAVRLRLPVWADPALLGGAERSS